MKEIWKDINGHEEKHLISVRTRKAMKNPLVRKKISEANRRRYSHA